MGIFGASQYESDVEKATSDKNVSEQWDLILEVCDKAGKTPAEAKEYLKAILRRISSPDPHVSLQAVTLLDACVKNCGKKFHVEVASRDFEKEYQKLIKKNHPKVVQKLKESLKRWAENEFKSDQQLDLIPSLYNELKSSGTDFVIEEHKPAIMLSKDPNVVQTQEEEDQIAKAIELSLKETSGAVKKTSAVNKSLYPSVNMPSMSTAPVKEPKKVRALYDFEAAEDNELTFNSGEIIFIIDDSDPNWWKGSNQRGEGLFPANFVTSDLSIDSDQLVEEKRKKIKELDDAMDKKLEDLGEPDETTEIDESKIDRLLHLLHEADPTNPEQDTKEMLNLEKTVNNMVPLIDKELERVDKKHAQLTQLSSDLVEALNLYHTLMREPQYPNMNVNKVPYGFPSSGPMPSSMPPGMGPHSMMGYSTLPHDRFVPPVGGNMPPHFNTLPHPQMHPPGHQSINGHPSMPPLNIHMPPPPQMHQERPRQPGPFPPPQEVMMGSYMHSSIPHSESQGPQSLMFMPTTASNTHMM